MATLNLGRIKPVFRGAYDNATAYVVDDIVTSVVKLSFVFLRLLEMRLPMLPIGLNSQKKEQMVQM